MTLHYHEAVHQDLAQTGRRLNLFPAEDAENA